MMRLGRPLVGPWLVPALVLLPLAVAPRVARGDCGRHVAVAVASHGRSWAAGLDELASIGLVPDATRSGPSAPGLPAAPCHGFRCSQGSTPPGAVSQDVRLVDVWGCLTLGPMAAPDRTVLVALADDALSPASRADRLDRPPR